MNDVSAERQLAKFIAKYSPEIAALARGAIEKMRTRLPGAVELVYDNYNGLAIGFGPDERASHLIFSITLYPRWVSLFFTHATKLPDPDGLLRGSGKGIRHIVLAEPADIDLPGVRALMTRALANAAIPIDRKAARRTIIKSISPKQRPRRPEPPAKKARPARSAKK